MVDAEPPWARGTTFRSEREFPYLAVGHANVFVRDQDRSQVFYRDVLGFGVMERQHGPDRFVAVMPPDGTAILVLIAPPPGSPEHDLIGRFTQVVFLCENVEANYREWSARGVRFEGEPERRPWGGMTALFQDPDGNSFALITRDNVTLDMQSLRQ